MTQSFYNVIQHRMDDTRYPPKVTRRLASELAKTGDEARIDVVIELNPHERYPAPPRARPAESITALRESFEADARPIADVVHNAGGEVSDLAWINRTVRASVRADALEALNACKQVASIDAPAPIELEA